MNWLAIVPATPWRLFSEYVVVVRREFQGWKMNAIVRFVLIVTCIYFGFLGAGIRKASSATIQAILPAGYTNNYDTNVSADGKVVAVSASAPTGAPLNYLWTPSQGLIPTTGLISLTGLDIDGDGTTIVSSGTQSAYIVEGSSSKLLGVIPGANKLASSQAHGISIDGKVVVGRSADPSGYELPFRWTEETGMVALGDLAGGLSFGTAYATDQDGSTVVGSSYSTSGLEAFRWTQATGMVGLGDLAGGQFSSSAAAMTPDGKVIVGGSSSSLFREAFRWSAETGMIGLGTLPGAITSEAFSVSADGKVIVGQAILNGAYVATIWDALHGTRDLKSVLQTDYGLDLAGWNLILANDISSNGKVIAGLGYHSSGAQSFYVVLPEPATSELSWMAMTGMIVVVLWKMRQLNRRTSKSSTAE